MKIVWSIILIFCTVFLPAVGQEAIVGDITPLTLMDIKSSYRFAFCNDSLQCLYLSFGDTVEVESEIPISEGAEIFIDWVKTHYDCKLYEVLNENIALKKEIEFLRDKLKKVE